MTTSTKPEFSRPVTLDELDDGTLHRRLEAGDNEREGLAHRFDLLSLDRLEATVTLARVPGGPLVRVDGRIEADVVQRCVVTLGPVAGHVEDSFSELYGPAAFEPEEDEEIPEPFDDDTIDVGELVAQRLSLALDPYPRAPGATLPGREEESAERQSPFAVLEALRKKR